MCRSAGQQPPQQRRPGLSIARGGWPWRGARSGGWAAPRSPVLLVVQLMAGATQDHDIGGEFGAEAFVGAVMHVEVFGMRNVQRAAIVRAQQRGCSGLPPLRRTQEVVIRHRVEFGEPTSRWPVFVAGSAGSSAAPASFQVAQRGFSTRPSRLRFVSAQDSWCSTARSNFELAASGAGSASSRGVNPPLASAHAWMASRRAWPPSACRAASVAARALARSSFRSRSLRRRLTAEIVGRRCRRLELGSDTLAAETTSSHSTATTRWARRARTLAPACETLTGLPA